MNDTRRQGKGPDSAEEAALSARLRSLGQRLDHVGPARKAEIGSVPRTTADASAFARGMRLSAELVGGVVVGFILGWLFDRGLGTSPWGLIVFVLLGFVAGVLNVMRSAGVIATPGGSVVGDDQPR
jgi:ATP synthase protein I